MSLTSKVRRRISFWLFVCALPFILHGIWLVVYLTSIGSVVANALTGEIYEIGNHGKCVYVTFPELGMCYGSFGIAFIIFLCAALLEGKSLRIRREGLK